MTGALSREPALAPPGTQDRFETLLAEWALLHDGGNLDALCRTGRVKVGGTVVEMVVHGEPDAQVALNGFFGALPTDDEGAAARELLAANFTLGVLGQPLFWSINPRTGQICAHGRVALEGLDAERLDAVLHEFVRLADAWCDATEERLLSRG